MNHILDEITKKIKTDSRPVISMCNKNYYEILENWILHVLDTGFESIFIIALDDYTFDKLLKKNIPCALVNADHEFGNVMTLRSYIFSLLCKNGIDFIHSDIDAIWLKNPTEFCFDETSDITFSQGTIWPPEALKRWGFVLCCGFFSVKANAKTRLFFAKVAEYTRDLKSDQQATNRILLEYDLNWKNLNIKKNLHKHDNEFFFIYDEKIYGKSHHISISMLPYKKFQRKIIHSMHESIVVHPLVEKKCKAKIEYLIKNNLWHRSLY